MAGSGWQVVSLVEVGAAGAGAALAGVAATSEPSSAMATPAALSRFAFMRCVPSVGLPGQVGRGPDSATFAAPCMPLEENFHRLRGERKTPVGYDRTGRCGSRAMAHYGVHVQSQTGAERDEK
ncbi:hypothetical protein GCM10027290_22350 [Micromonospora sonneratiae]